MRKIMHENEAKYRKWLDSKVTEYHTKEKNAVDAKEREYNAVKWAYVDALEEFDKMFGEEAEQEKVR